MKWTRNKDDEVPYDNAWYDEFSGMLRVSFVDGPEYTYHGVPKRVAQSFISAGKTGDHDEMMNIFNTRLREGQYDREEEDRHGYESWEL